MAVKKKLKKPESIIPQAKLLRLFQIIALLKTGKWSIKGIAQRFDASDRTIYRYIKLLEAVDFPVEKGFDNLYFILSSEDDPTKAIFTIEEMKLIKKLIQTEVGDNPLKGLLLKKLSLNSEMDVVPRLIVNARLGKLVDQIAQAIRNKKQIVLKDYHSANSSTIKDRLIEPIEFGDNYQTIMSFDTKDKECKQFKLDRIGEVIEMDTDFKFEQQHKKSIADIFGMTGKKNTWITLQLKMKAYLLLREDHPLSIPYCEKTEDGHYQFHGPINNFEGIARFVLGLLDEVKVVQPSEFKEYIRAKIDSKIVV